MTGWDLRIGNVCIDLGMTGSVWMHWLGLIIIGKDWFVLCESGKDWSGLHNSNHRCCILLYIYMHIFSHRKCSNQKADIMPNKLLFIANEPHTWKTYLGKFSNLSYHLHLVTIPNKGMFPSNNRHFTQ